MRMWRTVAIVLIASVVGAGCGGVRVPKHSGPAPCPEGTKFVLAVDLIGSPPPGFEVVAGDPEALKTFVAQFRRGYGDTWRGYDAKVLVRRNKVNGTAVVVLNADAKTPDNDDFVESAIAAEEAAGTEGEPIVIGGKQGRLRQGPDGAYIAVAPAGTCSMVVLAADKEKVIRRGAAAIQPS
jgi:hypothetical protein